MIDSLSAVELQMKISIHHWRLDLFKFTVISWRQKYASADTFVNALFVNMTISEEVERYHKRVQRQRGVISSTCIK